MMERVEHELFEIRDQLRKANPGAAERRCRALILKLGLDELRANAAQISATIDHFLPKRRRALSDLLTRAVLGAEEHRRSEGVQPTPPTDQDLVSALRSKLATLGNEHIFQWSTFYRDALAPLFEAFVVAETERADSRLAAGIRAEFAAHAYAIFSHGYEHTIRSVSATRAIAIAKSLGGLQRFLELPIEFYSALSSGVTTRPAASALRRVGSAILSGILEGIGSVRFGDRLGWGELTRARGLWAHYLGFCTYRDLAEISGQLERGMFEAGLASTVLPVVRAIDELVDERRLDYSALPVLGQYDANTERLLISLAPISSGAEGRLTEIQCFLDPGPVQTSLLEESSSRNVALLAAPLRADLAEWVESHDHLRSLVINTAALNSIDNLVKRAKDILAYGVAAAFGAANADAPLAYNFARDFPLHNPFLGRYFHVYRPSVRDLLGRFERRNGVRLWCSVRRSGKTTACFDLSSTTGSSTVISQTCDRTGQHPDADLFYKTVREALETRTRISDAFFRMAVERCSPTRRPHDIRYVFVLDEYETLFEGMRLAALRDPELRYTIVQPLLNQMVEFTSENLLVFIGQRPDAHFILMDQNQLSAYVQQDAFPLFAHGSGTSEFSELVRKVVTQRIGVEPEFLDALYGETSGHPFLTVKVLIELFDWLIASRRSVRSLHLSGQDFQQFSKSRLRPRELATSHEFQFFVHAISEALGIQGRDSTPWLHAVYAVTRQLADESGESLRCSRGDFVDIVNRLRLTEELGFTPERLLSTGAQSNFLAYSDSEVWPRIPILARIAQATRARMVL